LVGRIVEEGRWTKKERQWSKRPLPPSPPRNYVLLRVPLKGQPLEASKHPVVVSRITHMGEGGDFLEITLAKKKGTLLKRPL